MTSQKIPTYFHKSKKTLHQRHFLLINLNSKQQLHSYLCKSLVLQFDKITIIKLFLN